MRVGSACHLYAGAIRRGRSGRTLRTLGLLGWNESLGHAICEPVESRNVGVVKTAVFV